MRISIRRWGSEVAIDFEVVDTKQFTHNEKMYFGWARPGKQGIAFSEAFLRKRCISVVVWGVDLHTVIV